jgi:peptide/nickel transport system permease protein
MITEGQRFLERAWWIAIPPGMAITMTVLAVNLFGDWMRDYLDPKLRQI